MFYFRKRNFELLSSIAEAYYQKIPLIVITADRPPEWIDHGEGQSIRQQNIFSNYIEKSYQLPMLDHPDALCKPSNN